METNISDPGLPVKLLVLIKSKEKIVLEKMLPNEHLKFTPF